ncbi:4-hydroxy-4-methyl-2-oxoglutarate aldolase [compost metagenome]
MAEGEVNTPVSINGVNIYPGDIIVGDDDGLFALRPEHAAELGPAASDKQRKETLRRREKGYDKLLGWD